MVELGIHKGFKNPRPYGHAGSIPASGTVVIEPPSSRRRQSKS